MYIKKIIFKKCICFAVTKKKIGVLLKGTEYIGSFYILTTFKKQLAQIIKTEE